VNRIGLGEHGDVIFGTEKGRTVAIVQYRDFAGRKRRVKRAADSKAAARRLVLKAVDEALKRDGGGGFTASTPFSVGIDGWMAYVGGWFSVVRGPRRRSISTGTLCAGTCAQGLAA
jgi:hypothetical protein